MQNTIQEIIKKIIFLPKIYHELGNISFYALLNDSGYIDVYHKIKQNDIINILRNTQECIADWIIYSGDKRVSSGWYFIEDKGAYIVGFFSKDKSKNIKIKYTDKIQACADFIEKELNDILQKNKKLG